MFEVSKIAAGKFAVTGLVTFAGKVASEEYCRVFKTKADAEFHVEKMTKIETEAREWAASMKAEKAARVSAYLVARAARTSAQLSLF